MLNLRKGRRTVVNHNSDFSLTINMNKLCFCVGTYLGGSLKLNEAGAQCGGLEHCGISLLVS